MRLESSELRICNDILPSSSHALDGNGASTFPCFISCGFTQTWPLPPKATTPCYVHASLFCLTYKGWAGCHKYHQPCVKPPLLLYPPRFQRPCLTLLHLRLPDRTEVVRRTPNILEYSDKETNANFCLQEFCAAVFQTLNKNIHQLSWVPRSQGTSGCWKNWRRARRVSEQVWKAELICRIV
jgi:hypothetical protein